MASASGQRRNDRGLCVDGTQCWKCHSVLGDWSSLAERDHFILNGSKKWITCAQLADVFLVFGKLDQRSVACLVPKGRSWS